jgi:endonuclease/exonuclease/phosphatase family metal-dependent hydrolase
MNMGMEPHLFCLVRLICVARFSNDFKDERLVQFEKLIDQYDVICLQELFGAFSSRQNKFIAIAYEKGFKYHVASPKVSFLVAKNTVLY